MAFSFYSSVITPLKTYFSHQIHFDLLRITKLETNTKKQCKLGSLIFLGALRIFAVRMFLTTKNLTAKTLSTQRSSMKGGVYLVFLDALGVFSVGMIF